MLLSLSVEKLAGFMCTSPIHIRRVIAGKTKWDTVPCGKCAECLKKKQSNYTCRCIEEAKKLGRVWFITLTYSEQNCPKILSSDSKELRSLRRADVKKWKREVRRAYLRKYGVPFPSFSFLISGEYGSRTHRPHYHGFLCGLDLKYSQILQKYWEDNFGFALFKPIKLLNDNGHDDVACVARYVAKYCVKPQLYKLNPLQEKPRIQTSPNFGLPQDFERYANYMRDGLDVSAKKFLPAQVSKINERCKYTYNGVDYSLPIYLRKKIFYEKNFKGNLQSSRLCKACSDALRVDPLEDVYSELLELVSVDAQREIIEMVPQILEAEESNIRSRQIFSNNGLLNDYKKDNF